MPGYSLYSSSKAAVIRLTESLSQEVAPCGVTVNAIAPGFIATGIHQATLQAGKEASGALYEKTKMKLDQGGDDPAQAAKLALRLATKECLITGKLLSAIFDPWEDQSKDEKLDPDLYTLRRIDNTFYQKIGS